MPAGEPAADKAADKAAQAKERLYRQLLKNDGDDARAKAGLDEAVAKVQSSKAASTAALSPNEVVSKSGLFVKKPGEGNRQQA